MWHKYIVRIAQNQAKSYNGSAHIDFADSFRYISPQFDEHHDEVNEFAHFSSSHRSKELFVMTCLARS
jgi:hypothetical protein